MKLRKLFLTVLAGAALLMACDKKEVDLGPAKLTVNPTDLEFGENTASQDINLVATRDWAVTGLPDWIALSKESGSAHTDAQKISISVTQNKGYNRSATLTFTIGFARSVLHIAQEGPNGVVDNGDGTKTNPYNAEGVIAYVTSLGDKESEGNVYVKGKISAISDEFTTQYGTGTFTISEDGTTEGAQFTAYRVSYLGNKKFTASDTQIKVGDDVILYGKVVNFKGNTPETVQGSAFLFSLNGVDKGGDDSGQGGEGTPKGTGTLEDPYNPAGIAAVAAALADNAVSTESYYMKGKISKIAVSKNVDQTFANSGNYGNASFYITDSEDATGEFYIYQTYYLGNRKWVTGDTDIKVGDEVIVYGPVTKYVSSYGTTLETSGKGASYIYSLNGDTGGTVVPPTPIEHDGLTPETAFTASEANAWIMGNLEDKASTETKYYVKGKIQRFYVKENADQNFTNNSFHQASFFITDDGTENKEKEFEAYQIDYLNDATFDPAKDTDVKVGDEVVIYGALKRWGTTAETTDKGSAYLYSVKPGGEVPPPPGPGGDEVGIMETNVTMIAGTNAYDDGKLTVTYNGTEYKDVKHIKYGKGTAYGNGSIVLPAGTVEIEFFAVGWKGDDATLQFTIGETVKKVNVAANDGAANTSPYTMTVADSDHYTVSLGSALAVETTVKVETIADANTGHRAFLFGVHAKKTSGGDTPGGDTPAKPVNEGTLESPYTVADALIAAKDADLTGKEYYVKAIVGKDIAIKNGTASFELMDGTTDGKLTVVKAKSFKGAAFDGSEPLDWLDEVVLKGTVTEYSTLPALTDGEFILWNGKKTFKEAETNLAKVIAAADNADVYFTAVVSAVTTNSFVVTDGTNNFYVFKPATMAAIGDKVTVSGVKTTYKGIVETSQGAEVEVVETGKTVEYTVADDITATFDAYPASNTGNTSDYVTFTGKLVKSGNFYNVEVEGATTYKGSVSNPIAALGLDALVDKTVDFTGYYVGTNKSGNNNFINFVCTKAEEYTQGGGGGGEQPTYASNVEWTLGENAYSEKATVNDVADVDVLKLGTSKKIGKATLPLPAGTTKLTFYAVSWKDKPSKLVFKAGDTEVESVEPAANDGLANNSPYTLTVTDSDNKYEITIPSGATSLTVETSGSNTRAALFGIVAE